MPAWITSLLREEMPVPMPSACSATITSWPAIAAARATASPITPAPTTRTCISGFLAVERLHLLGTVAGAGYRALRHCRLDAPQRFTGERHIGGLEDVGKLGAVARAGKRHDVVAARQHPGEGELRQSEAKIRCDLLQRRDQLGIGSEILAVE